MKPGSGEGRAFWILLKRGRVQWYSTGEQKGVLFAENRTAAVKAVKRLGIKGKVSPALVGTVQGETLETVLAASFNAGANTAFVFDASEQLWRL